MNDGNQLTMAITKIGTSKFSLLYFKIRITTGTICKEAKKVINK